MKMAWMCRLALGATLALAAGSLAACGDDVSGVCADTTCGTGTSCCEVSGFGLCVNTNADVANCGSCGNACGAGQACTGGICTAPPDAGPPDGGRICTPACAAGLECCGTSTCVPRMGVPIGQPGQSDVSFQNCAGCGQSCNPDTASACSVVPGSTMRRCMCGSQPACDGGKVCAPSGGSFVCVDLPNDRNNCGEIGNVCPAGEDCSGGECGCGTTGEPCATGQTCCSGACLDLQTDDAHCGSCTMGCNNGNTCAAGVCSCGGVTCRAREEPNPITGPDPEEADKGQICCEETCVDVDDSNCGACGTECLGTATDTCYFQSMGFPPGFPPYVICCGDPNAEIGIGMGMCRATPDAGVPADGGPRDAGPTDAGPRDAGPRDAGIDSGT